MTTSSSPSVAASAPATSGQFLTFSVEGGEYGVDIMSVREIRGWTATTRLPNAPEFMRGVINLRGVVIPIFDLRARFGMGLTEANEKNVVVVLAIGGRTIGVLADAVSDILSASLSDIKPAPSGAKELAVGQEYITGLLAVESKMVVLLDVEKLFTEESLENATAATAAASIAA